MKKIFYVEPSLLLNGIINLSKSSGAAQSLCRKKYLSAAIFFLAALILPAPGARAATFTNPTQINLPLNFEISSLCPSPIQVSGLTTVISSTPGSVRVAINGFSHSVPSQAGMVLCGPTGACFLLQSLAGGTTTISNVTYTLSDAGAAPLPQAAFTAGTYRPTAYALRSFPNPGPNESYQNPGPVSGGTATLTSAFQGTNPNGIWNLYVVGGAGRLNGGWTLDVETVPVAHPQHTVDFDGDSKTDFVIVRNSGVGLSTYWLNQTTAGTTTKVFGRFSDVVVPGDYDGDGKTDYAVARDVSGALHWWYLRSSDSQAVQTVFGASTTDRLTPGDYDGDGKTDIAIWRQSASAGQSAFWVKSTFSGVSSIPFGQSGDYPVANFNVH
ncbi:MAG TPA: VCBS repeat-containing protein [Pyrinomonadaceae bacterium]|jgi:hypothetical protein